MEYKLYREEDFKTSQRIDGRTQELVLYPESSTYLERNFIWRLSLDFIEKEEANLSRLPDYDRILMVVDGEVVLSHEEQRVTRLKELEQDRFDGAYKTKSFGPNTALHLMVRKGNEAYLDVIYPEKTGVQYGATQETEKSKIVHILYCKKGYCVITLGTETVMIKEGQVLTVTFSYDEENTYHLMGEGIVIRGQIFCEDMAGEIGPELIPAEKPSFDDFKACIYLSNVQFRLAKYVIKKLRTQWFDEALSAAIRKVEKFYLTMIAFMIGFMCVCYFGVKYLDPWQGIGLFLIWVLLDCFVISPLIYLPFMPKPIRKHIKDVDRLTSYEQRIRAEELGQNERLEKVLKKYKNSGRNIS